MCGLLNENTIAELWRKKMTQNQRNIFRNSEITWIMNILHIYNFTSEISESVMLSIVFFYVICSFCTEWPSSAWKNSNCKFVLKLCLLIHCLNRLFLFLSFEVPLGHMRLSILVYRSNAVQKKMRPECKFFSETKRKAWAIFTVLDYDAYHDWFEAGASTILHNQISF